MTLPLEQKAGDYLEELTLRLSRLGFLVLLALGTIGLGYWYHQILRAERYERLAENNRLRREPITAPRGVIEDVRGRLLVENIPSYSLLLDRTLVRDIDESLAFAASMTGTPTEDLQEVFDQQKSRSRFRPMLIAEDLDLVRVARFESMALEHPEFRVEVEQRRLYRHGEQTGHLLGYLGEATAADLERAPAQIRAGDLVGREGIEQSYDERLRGFDGLRELVVDSRGREIDQLGRRPVTPGQRLRLTIDLDLQQEAQELMSGSVGSIVAIDPRSGAVRVMFSGPGYDPNLFTRRLRSDAWRELVSNPDRVLQNRSIHNTYPPGSTFKIPMSVAGLSEGVIDPDEKIYCSGSKKYYQRARRCWKRGGHGWMDLRSAIQHSCDIYFYDQGQKLGVDQIAHYARLFGLGTPTGVDLSGERSGLVPDVRWSQESRGHPWYPGETISVAIGQGPLLSTPLQIAVMTAMVANGGYRVTPHVVSGHGTPPRLVELEKTALDIVADGLWAVVNENGSGASARLVEYEIGGKTGTAQVVEQKTWTDSDDLPEKFRDHAWFTSYGPFDAPELVVVVFVENGGAGSRTAAPMAKAIYESYFQHKSERR